MQIANVSIFLVLTTVLVILSVFLPDDFIRYCFRHTAYYVLFVTVVCWVYLSLSLFRPALMKMIRKHYPALVLAIVVTCLVFLISPPRFKTLTDEANLIGVSMMMHYERTVGVPVEAYFVDFAPPEYTIVEAKRPLLYPFCVSLLHAILGYTPNNGFVLNFMASILILTAMYLFLTRFFASPMGYIGILLTASCPIYAFCISANSFEPLNLLFVLLVFLLFHNLLTSEFNPRKVDVVFLTSLLLAQCRYESAIIVPIIAVVLLPFMVRNRFFYHFSLYTFLLPFFALPIFWQRRLLLHHPELNKTGMETFVRPDIPFSIQHLLNNFDNNIFVLLGLNPDYGYTFIISALAVTGLYLIIRKFILAGVKTDVDRVRLAGVAAFTALLVIISSFYWGHFTLPINTRLSFVFLPFVITSALIAIQELQNKWKINPRILFILSLCSIVFYWPVGARQTVLRTTILPYAYENVLYSLKQHYPRKGYSLILAEYPTLYTIQNFSAFRINNEDRIRKYLSEPSIFDHIIAIQKYDKQTGKIYKGSQLPLSANVKTIEDISLSPTIGLRISELIRS